jgi:hypothetical protein
MEDVILEPVELTASELDVVTGGVAIAENLVEVAQANVVGNRSLGGGFASVNVNATEIVAIAHATNIG